ncbi:MAG: ImmA/IrrE family metallo-endopeptidase [Acidobacteriota bacterium]
MSQAELCSRMGRSRKLINEIIKGKAQVAPETALQLEYALDKPAAYWSSLEIEYQDHLARQQHTEEVRSELAWLDELPVREMIDAQWLEARDEPLDQAKTLLKWFGVMTPAQWREVYAASRADIRRSPERTSDPGALAAWLRAGELQSYEMATPPYDRKRFQRALQEIRGLTREHPTTWQDRMIELCIESGVALSFARELPGMRVAGASRWLSPRKALIQLSLLDRTDADMWFTFYHEAAHILLHGRKIVFVEGVVEGKPSRDDVLEEIEADQFAGNTLIPAQAIEELRVDCDRRRLTSQQVRRFARREGITPGIVVTRLQRLGWIAPQELNALKNPLTWAPPGTYVER